MWYHTFDKNMNKKWNFTDPGSLRPLLLQTKAILQTVVSDNRGVWFNDFIAIGGIN